MNFRKIIFTLLLGFSLALGISACDDAAPLDTTPLTPTPPADDIAANDVTLTGALTLATSTAPAVKILKRRSIKRNLPLKLNVVATTTGTTTPVTADEFVLYCVTFTAPPLVGEGIIAADGTFSVTIFDAAGLSIGCFINDKLTNTPITSIVFDTGVSTGLDDASTDSSTAIKGGTHAMNINFDPDSGIAEAVVEVSAIETAVVATSINTTQLSGEWTLTCASLAEGNTAKELELCNMFLREDDSTPDLTIPAALPLFINVIEGTLAGETVYAMSPWQSKAAFDACGATEAINMDTLTNVSSVFSLDPSLPFSGMMSDASYDATTHSIPADRLIASFVADGSTDMSLVSDPYGNPSDPYSFSARCSGYTDISTVGFKAALDSTTDYNAKGCFLQFASIISETSNKCYPRISNAAWDSYSQSGTSTSPIPFDKALGGASVSVGPRFTLMPMEIKGNTAIATDYQAYYWSEYDQSTDTTTDCASVHELTLAITPESATKAFGRFTQGGYDNCNQGGGGGGPAYGSFFTIFSKI